MQRGEVSTVRSRIRRSRKGGEEEEEEEVARGKHTLGYTRNRIKQRRPRLYAGCSGWMGGPSVARALLADIPVTLEGVMSDFRVHLPLSSGEIPSASGVLIYYLLATGRA